MVVMGRGTTHMQTSNVQTNVEIVYIWLLIEIVINIYLWTGGLYEVFDS